MLACSVISWEPVPQFRAFFEYSTARNGLVDKIQIRPAVVVSEPGKMFNVIIPQRGIWGLASIGGANLDKGVDNQGEYGQVGVTTIVQWTEHSKLLMTSLRPALPVCDVLASHCHVHAEHYAGPRLL